MTPMLRPTLVLLRDDSEIDERKQELLASIAIDEDELRKRGAEYLLAPEEAVVLRELENLDFLLASDG